MTTPVVTPSVQAHVDGAVAALEAVLPGAVYDGKGPVDPAGSVPYVVINADPGAPGAYPFTPGRDFTLTIALTGVGVDARQCRWVTAKARDGMLAGITVPGRHATVYQDPYAVARPQQDEGITPSLFSSLIVFDVRSDPA